MRREYPSRPIPGVGAVIIHDRKLVLVRRGVEPGKGKWSIPGGAVELGERVRDTARREAEEECGLNIELVDDIPMDVMDNMVTDKKGRLQYHYILLQFLARPRSGTLKPTSDVTEARWVSLDEIDKYNLTNSFRLFFNKHRNRLKKF